MPLISISSIFKNTVSYNVFMQIIKLHTEIDILQLQYGEEGLSAIYGAGCIKNPELMLIFMNPTGKNISSDPKWEGLRAPWIGTKNIWLFLREIGVLSEKILQVTRGDWNVETARAVYKELARNKIYITNLAKCTQADARGLSNSVFRAYMSVIKKEIALVNPKRIITFGNQVSSIFLEKSVSVSDYRGKQKDVCKIKEKLFDVYPTYYPIGQGRRNQPLAVKRIRTILK